MKTMLYLMAGVAILAALVGCGEREMRANLRFDACMKSVPPTVTTVGEWDFAAIRCNQIAAEAAKGN